MGLSFSVFSGELRFFENAFCGVSRAGRSPAPAEARSLKACAPSAGCAPTGHRWPDLSRRTLKYHFRYSPFSRMYHATFGWSIAAVSSPAATAARTSVAERSK